MLAAGDPRPESEVSDTVEGPLAVSLDRLNPSQKELLEDLLAEADREPMNGLTRGKLGMAYEMNGYPEAALKSYRQAEELDGQEPRWPYHQALLLAARGELGLALSALDRSIHLDATHLSSWMWMGTWSIELGTVSYTHLTLPTKA
mgnify:CR=1 FL=1